MVWFIFVSSKLKVVRKFHLNWRIKYDARHRSPWLPRNESPSQHQVVTSSLTAFMKEKWKQTCASVCRIHLRTQEDNKSAQSELKWCVQEITKILYKLISLTQKNIIAAWVTFIVDRVNPGMDGNSGWSCSWKGTIMTHLNHQQC